MVLAKVKDRAGQQEGTGSPGQRERWPAVGSFVIPSPRGSILRLTLACEVLWAHAIPLSSRHWAHAITHPQGEGMVHEPAWLASLSSKIVYCTGFK